MVTERVNHQQDVGNGRRPASHHPIPGNMWTEGLSTADLLQEKKKDEVQYVATTCWFVEAMAQFVLYR